jgi:hypothetical protein
MLSEESRNALGQLDMLRSTQTHEHFPRNLGSPARRKREEPALRQRWDAFISKLSDLLHFSDDETRERAKKVLSVFKHLHLFVDGVATGRSPNSAYGKSRRSKTIIDWNHDREAMADLAWLSGKTGDRVVAKRFAEALARRCQQRLSKRQTWVVVNRLFYEGESDGRLNSNRHNLLSRLNFDRTNRPKRLSR